MQELIVLKMCLKPLIEEAPHVVQLDIARYCVNDKNVPCAQLDLCLCCTAFLQQAKIGRSGFLIAYQQRLTGSLPTTENHHATMPVSDRSLEVLLSIARPHITLQPQLSS